jgi:hypothetical protein
MEHLETPLSQVWEERQDWFENLFDVDNKGWGGYIMSEHATGLLVDLQAVYCAGAFIACIILSCAIIDAHLQDAEGANGGNMQSTFAASSYHDKLEWLRKRRNRLVHFKENHPLAISVDDHWENREQHELEAKKAIELVANVFFENPWI